MSNRPARSICSCFTVATAIRWIVGTAIATTAFALDSQRRPVFVWNHDRVSDRGTRHEICIVPRRLACGGVVASKSCRGMTSNDEHSCDARATTARGLYRRFASYTWNKLVDNGLFLPSTHDEPVGVLSNSAPLKGTTTDTVHIEVASHENSRRGTSSLRLARYALLETLPTAAHHHDDTVPPQSSKKNAIHVFNLVLFPTPDSPIPIFGADLVTLPGGKNLVAIDFQPTQDSLRLPPAFETNLRRLHDKHCLRQPHILPWGGDIPPSASRFFSNYALWTRFPTTTSSSMEEGVMHDSVWNAYRDYLNLYIDLLLHTTTELAATATTTTKEEKDLILRGHRDYLTYRRNNDPARPMLKRLYGEEWAENVISNVLFGSI